MPNSDFIFEPYMAFIQIEHQDNQRQQYCAGAQSCPPGLVEISLYAAGLNEETRETKKGNLLFRSRMTEYQFGMMVAKPNTNDGQLCTNEFTRGYAVNPYLREADPEAKKLHQAIEKHLSPDPHVEAFLHKLQGMTQEALDKGRMSKTLQTQIARYLQLSAGSLDESRKFNASMINEVAHQRVREAKVGMRRLITSQEPTERELIIDRRDTEDLPSIEAPGFLQLSTSRSTSQELFADINIHANPLALSFRLSRVNHNTDSNSPPCYQASKMLWEILFSAELYPTLLRGDGALCCCTLIRFAGQRTPKVPIEHTAEIPKQTDINSDEFGDDGFVDAACDIYDKLIANHFKGKVGLTNLNRLVEELPLLYRDYLSQNHESAKRQALEILHKQKKHFERECAAELLRITESTQADIDTHIQRISNHLYHDIKGDN